MAWAIIGPDSECPVVQIIPVGEHHRSGIQCNCSPCYDDDPEHNKLLVVHHQMRDGHPIPCTEAGGHKCVLK